MAKDSKRILTNLKNASLMLAATLTMTACDGPKNTGEEKTQEPKSVTAVVPLTPQEAKEHVATLDSLRRAAYQEAVEILKKEGEKGLSDLQKQLIQEMQAEQNTK